MGMPEKVVDFFLENRNQPKNEVIKLMMDKFNYKESTALSYYSNRNDNVKNKKEIVFKFFKENPYALEDISNSEYVNKLGISKLTYTKYKSEYIVLHPIQINKGIQEWDKYYKGRLRRKFNFDDSKLFG